ncbi:MAG: low molecular weight protein tyrosine phosphatase family protein [Verrucomicrobiota bacterium]
MENLPEHPLKILFVCSRNRLRSLTAEEIFSGIPGVQVRSVGTQPEARVVVTEGLIGWADVILVMETSHLNRLRLRFPEALEGKQTGVLRIPDDYGFMDPDLVDELKAKVPPLLGLPDL